MWWFLLSVPLRLHHVLQPVTCALPNTGQASYAILKAEHILIWALSNKSTAGIRTSLWKTVPPFLWLLKSICSFLELQGASCTVNFHLSGMRDNAVWIKEKQHNVHVKLGCRNAILLVSSLLTSDNNTVRLETWSSKLSQWFITASKGRNKACYSCYHQHSQFRGQKELEQH